MNVAGWTRLSEIFRIQYESRLQKKDIWARLILNEVLLIEDNLYI